MKIPFHISDEKYAQIMRRQREQIEEIAAKLEGGESLNEDETGIAVWAMRTGAASLPDKPPKRAGNPGKLPDGEVALTFAAKVIRQGKSKSQAREELAELYDVSVEAIRQCLKKHGDDAMGIVNMLAKSSQHSPPKEIK